MRSMKLRFALAPLMALAAILVLSPSVDAMPNGGFKPTISICATGEHKDANGRCIADCKLPKVQDSRGYCELPACSSGQHHNSAGKCIAACKGAQFQDSKGDCVCRWAAETAGPGGTCIRRRP